MAVPVIAQAVDFSVRVQAAMKVAKDTGDDGHRLLEFSQYRDMSWCELYESDKADHVRFIRNFILPKSDCKRGTKMDLFRQYCLVRESQQRSSHPACASGSAAAMPQLSGKIIYTRNCSSNLQLLTCIIVYGHWQCILLSTSLLHMFDL